jgi:hypothetical protein
MSKAIKKTKGKETKKTVSFFHDLEKADRKKLEIHP